MPDSHTWSVTRVVPSSLNYPGLSHLPLTWGSMFLYYISYKSRHFNACASDAEFNSLEFLSPTVVPGHGNWQIQTAVWNWAGVFTEELETRWQRFGRFLNDL